MYLGPIMAAPLAHISVSLYRTAKTPRAKAMVLGVGVLGATGLSVGMRMYLMVHAGYAGGTPAEAVQHRVHTVHHDEVQRVQNPSYLKVLKEALRGFG